jgi:hypothetical protein
MGALSRVPQSEPKLRLQGRLSLNKKPAPVIAQLPSEPAEYSEQLNSVQPNSVDQFESWLRAERNDFSIRQHQRGLGRPDVLIKRGEAERRLKLALGALAERGAE